MKSSNFLKLTQAFETLILRVNSSTKLNDSLDNIFILEPLAIGSSDKGLGLNGMLSLKFY